MIRLTQLSVADAEWLQEMQKRAFLELYEKYRDAETNPYNETLARVTEKLSQGFTYFYRIDAEGVPVGAIRVVDFHDERKKRISPLFILPAYRGHGYAQEAIRAAEAIHGDTGWDLGTILQEPRNIHLYEKMGYRPSGRTTYINERMTIIGYTK